MLMRTSVLVILALFALLVIDQFAFDGQYSQAVWQEARNQSYRFNQTIADWLSGIGR
jgi:hypothetical protein